MVFGIKGAATAAFGDIVLDFGACVPLLASVEGVKEGESTFNLFLSLATSEVSMKTVDYQDSRNIRFGLRLRGG
jgi:hypothetical protein